MNKQLDKMIKLLADSLKNDSEERQKELLRVFEENDFSSYDIQAYTFLLKSNTEFKVKYVKHDFYFQNDKQTRDIYRITLKRNGEKYSFKFGQSINNSNYGNNPPSAYDVLACLTKYDPESFHNFCDEFGYDEDSKKAEKIYKAVQKEYDNIISMFGEDDTINDLREIQ